MSTSQLNGITKDDLGKKYPQFGTKPLSLNTVRQTLQSCGLDTSKRAYTSEEEEKFKAARRLIQEEGKTYQGVAEHFKIDLGSAGSDSGDAFFENQATEATASGDVAFELATSISRQQAQRVAELVPALTVYHLNQMMSDGTVAGKLRTLAQKIGQSPTGNTHDILMAGIAKLEEAKALPASTKTSIPASSATSTVSSANKSEPAAKK